MEVTNMENNRQIKFVVNAVKWFDKVNGNTYHSVSIVRVSDSARLVSLPINYGYGEHYRQTALEIMLKAGWLPEQYTDKTTYLYERENDYPIMWNVRNGLKRELKENVR